MLTCQKHLFNLDEDWTFINGAYQSPLLKATLEAGNEAMFLKASPNNIHKEHFFEPVEEGKGLFSELINCTNPDRIAVVPSASYASSTMASNISLKSHENVVVLHEQFPSNIYPWMRLAKENNAELRKVQPDSGESRAAAWTQALLHSIDTNTKVVTIPIVHWAEGLIFDIHQIRKKCDEVNALLIIDGTQSVGIMPFDLQEIKPDALFCSSYKWLLGPYGFGYAYFGEAFDHGMPIEDNWINRADSDNFQNLVNYNDEYKSVGHKFSMGGQSNFIFNAMMIPALKQLLEWSQVAMYAYCQEIGKHVRQELTQHGFTVDDESTAHLFRVKVPEHIPLERVKQKLTEAKIHVSYRGSGIRVSPSVYNTEEDLARLNDVLLNV